jgi:cell division protein FtsB
MRRLFPLLILVFSAASLVIFFFGDSGVLSQDDLARYRDRLAANVADLEARNAALQARLTQLRDDPTTTRVMARDLGLFAPGDAVVRIEGLPKRPETNAVGDLLRYRREPDARNAVVKTVGIGLSMVLFAWGLLRSAAGRRRAHAAQGR